MERTAATAALEGRYAALSASASTLSSEELLDVIELAQREKDAASARQAVALAHLSALDSHVQEDGTSVEVHHGLGYQRLDGPELVAPRIGCSVHVATNRILDAIRQMTRTPAVVDAMASGDLDEQRARTVTEETEFLSAESAAEVVDRVKDVWAQLTVGPLRQLVARTAAQVDPDAVTAHAEDERARRGLTRRTGVHGTDHWRGDFLVEDARGAWAAVTERARQLVREGKADSLELARADAMMELILEHSDVQVIVHTTRAATNDDDDDDANNDTTAPPPPAAPTAPTDDFVPDTDTAHPDGAGSDQGGGPAADVSDDFVPDTDPTSDGFVPDTDPTSDGFVPQTDTASSSRASAVEDLVEVGGLGRSGTTFVRRDWIEHAGHSHPERELRCDTRTGALLHGDVPKSLARGQGPARRAHRARERAEEAAREHAHEHPDQPAPCRTTSGGAAVPPTDTTPEDPVDFTESYRVPDPMARLIRLRDGACRFPGCATPAVKCDLDHVRPWPAGPTTPTNLMCLCRRHHRIKQRAGWTATLHPDATTTWTDPTGLTRTTWPVDHLHLITAGHTHRDPTTFGRATTDPTRIPSTFEEQLTELLNTHHLDQHHLTHHHRPTAPTGFTINGTPTGSPPRHHRIDLDHNPPWANFLVDIPPLPPDPIPF